MSKFYRDRKGFFTAFFKSSGLYLVVGATALVLVCIAVILFAPDSGGNLVDAENPPPVLTDTSSVEPKTDSSTDTVSADTKDTSVSAPVTEPEQPEPAKDVMMILPVNGEISTPYSASVPVFSQTMNDWRVHQGIDYRTEGEEAVSAAADGIVENVYTSELMGLTVEIRHADGVLSIYQSLSGEAEVIKGQEVRQGDLIGKTGTSADCECLTGNHLHFALLQNGVYLDPNERLAS